MSGNESKSVNAVCARCVHDCKQTASVVVQGCAKFSEVLTLDVELRTFNRRKKREAQNRTPR